MRIGRNFRSKLAVSVLIGGAVLGWVSLLSHGAKGDSQTFDEASVEVVQSVPVETTLAVPGIRMTQDVWLEMIRAAQASIDIEQFYISSQSGESLEPVLAAIEDAAGRGVMVRVLVDAGFYKTYPDDPNALSQIPGITVRTIDFSAQKGIQHAKYFVVDGKNSYVGSANFDWLALTHIHEIGLHVVDAVSASNIESVFNLDWAKGSPVSAAPKTPKVYSRVERSPMSGLARVPETVDADDLTVYSSPAQDDPADVAPTLPNLVSLMNAATSTLRIQVYEYTTKVYEGGGSWKDLDSAIRSAAARGVSVELMVDAVALKDGKEDLEALAGVDGVEVRTVTIPQWSGGAIPYARLIHSKYAVADGASAWVGSENWSKDYFDSSRNVGFILSSADLSATLTQVFDRVWSSPYATELGQ